MLQGYPITQRTGPLGPLRGLTTSYVSATTLGVASGVADIDNGSGILLPVTFAGFASCLINTAWAAGNAQGKRVSVSTFGASATFHIFLVYNTVTFVSDIMIDDNIACSNANTGGRSGWIVRRIASLMMDGSGNLRTIFQVGNCFYHSPRADSSFYTNLLGSSNLLTLLVPSGVKVEADVVASFANVSLSATLVLMDPAIDPATDSILADAQSRPGEYYNYTKMTMTNTSRQVRAVIPVNGINLYIGANGWRDVAL